MYCAQITKDRIKNECKNKKINMEKMLVECELGVNAIRQINDAKGMASFSLAKIADYLDCSVDYLLGRTDIPELNRTNILPYTKEPSYKIVAYGADGTEGTQPPIEEKTT